jgi:outer membrane lipoprotein-sorting protein
MQLMFASLAVLAALGDGAGLAAAVPRPVALAAETTEAASMAPAPARVAAQRPGPAAASAARALPPPAASAGQAPAMAARAALAEASAIPDEANALAFADVADAALVERVRAAIEAISTLQADFTQIAPSGATSTGRFYLRRPGLLRFEYDRPTQLLIVATGGTVFVRDERLETTDSYPVGRTPLKYLLKKRVELDDARVISVDRGVDTVAVSFAPTQEETDGELTVILTAPALQLKQWIVRDPQNGVTVVSLANVEAGGDIPNRLFRAPEAGAAFLKD